MNVDTASLQQVPGGILLQYTEPGKASPREVYLSAVTIAEALLAADALFRGLVETSGFPVSGAPYCYEFRTRTSQESVVDALVWLRKRGLVSEYPARNGLGPIVELRSTPL